MRRKEGHLGRGQLVQRGRGWITRNRQAGGVGWGRHTELMAAAYMPMEHQIFLGCESTQKDKIQATFRELAPTQARAM